ncbi:MAG: hypothetical protein KI786_19820 [Mameliella sp.]|nr:hypothetical protein [Phaeodactylibacter sp.]
MTIKYILTILLIGMVMPVFAQSQLSNYIEKGLESNTALKQLGFQLQAAQAALAEAEANRSNWCRPDVSIHPCSRRADY